MTPLLRPGAPWFKIHPASTLAATGSSADETVVSAVPQIDGTITIVSTGGTGPYSVTSLDGYGTLTGASVTFTGLIGQADYSFTVTDSLFATFTVTVHCFRAAYTGSVIVSGGRGPTNYPVGNVSQGPASTMSQFNTASMVGGGTANLVSVDFQLTFATLKNDYSSYNLNFPASCHYNATTFTAYSLLVQSVTRISGTITRPTVSGTQTVLILGIFAGSSSVTPASVNFSDGTTLAAMTGVGNLTVLYTSVHPVANTAGSTGCAPVVNHEQYGWSANITYNFSVPRQ